MAGALGSLLWLSLRDSAFAVLYFRISSKIFYMKTVPLINQQGSPYPQFRKPCCPFECLCRTPEDSCAVRPASPPRWSASVHPAVLSIPPPFFPTLKSEGTTVPGIT